MKPRIIQLRKIGEMERGYLAVAELAKELPFLVHRIFLIYGANNTVMRGGHAHREQHQFLLCPTGEARVIWSLPLGETSQAMLRTPDVGIHVPPRVWLDVELKKGAVLQVFASGNYSDLDYIRSRGEFDQLGVVN
jgi:UDP-2-acetamido-3-amino-2,3-dideoxy-glucuronate N-acetyltransferase